jgi:cytochrome c peroxidase
VPTRGWGDGLAKAKGRDGKSLARNTPTLLNVGFQEAFFWDGRATTLDEQALGPIQSADEMHQDLTELEAELRAVPGYVQQFQDVFGTTVTRDGIAKALAAFERTLITRPSPLDRYLMGDRSALSEEAKEGLRLFTEDAGCIQCHRGPRLSDGKYYRLSVWQHDKGRGAVTGQSADDHKFRTPSLRNVGQTGPYLHDGSEKTLLDVVTFYYRGAPSSVPNGPPLDIHPLLGQSYSEIAPLVAFLESLTGEIPEVTPPKLP